LKLSGACARRVGPTVVKARTRCFDEALFVGMAPELDTAEGNQFQEIVAGIPAMFSM
jgi:hypothetical protein